MHNKAQPITASFIIQRKVINMSTEILVAILALMGTLGGSYFANNKNQAVMDEKIKDIKDDIKVLSERVNKHNNLVERMAVVEEKVKHIEH